MTLTTSSSTFLFLLRVVAVYNGSPYIVIPFSIIWLSIVATGSLTAAATHGMAIGKTRRCVLTGEDKYGVILAPLLIGTVFDTLVFLAISYRLLKVSGFSFLEPPAGAGVGKNESSAKVLIWTWWAGFKESMSGKNLPTFLRLVLRGGQKYYL